MTNKNFKIFAGIFGALLFVLILFIASVDEKEYNKQKAYITLTFDDGYEEHITVAFPILKKHNVTATEYVIAGLIGGYFENTKLMTTDDIKILEDAGWEIGSHSMTHPFLTTLNDSQLTWELEESKNILQSNKFKVNSFSVPYGDYNDRVKRKCWEHYQSVRPSLNGYNSLNNLDKYELKSKWVLNSTTLEDMKSWVDYARDNDLGLIIMLHHVSNNLSNEYTITPENLDKLIQYIKNQNIEIKTVSAII